MANLYWATGLTGGLTGYLDAISVTDAAGDGSGIPLAAGDVCIVASENIGFRVFMLQDSAGAVEDGSFVIIPDDNSGDLWWKHLAAEFPKGAGILYFGSAMPPGWANINGSTTITGQGQIIVKQ